MDKSTLNKRKHREWWWLLLIPFTLILLDSYGGLPLRPLPVWTHSEATVYRVKAEQAQQLSLTLPQTLSAEPVQGRLVHSSGDIHLLVTKKTGPHQIALQVPALPPGHYQMFVTQGKTEQLHKRLHVLPRPALILDRYFVQAGDTLSLWRNKSTPTRYRISGFSEQSLTAQNPHAISIPEDLPAGRHRLQVSGVGSVSFEVLGAPTPPLVTVKPHHDLVLPGVDQSLYLHILDAQQRPLQQGWIRIHEKSYAINEGLAIVALPAKSVASELLFTAGVAEGQIEQGRLQLQLAKAPWAIGLVPAQAMPARAQQLQWIGPHREALSWQARQGPLSLSGHLPATAPLQNLYEQLNRYFQSDRPVSLRFVDRQGRGQGMTVQFPPSQTSGFSIQPPQPHALSAVEIKSPATHLPWVNHYLPGTYAWSNATPAFSDEPLEPGGPDWCFVWLLAGLLCSSLPWWWARQQTQRWQATLEQSKRLKRARNGVLIGASLWLLSLPAAWLGEAFFMGQTYLLGLTLSSLSIIWAVRKAPPLQPVWIFTQTALLCNLYWKRYCICSCSVFGST